MSVAQPRPFPPEKMSDEQIIQMQIKDIVSWLDFDKQTEERFVKEYSAFRKEIDAVAKSARPPKDLESEEEIDKALQGNFEVSQKILNIRKKYYQIFSEFMKPSQIRMMYRIENEAGRRMHGGPGGRGPESRGPGGRGPEGRGPVGQGPDGPNGPEGRPEAPNGPGAPETRPDARPEAPAGPDGPGRW